MIVVQGAIRRANPYLYSPKPEALSDLDAYFPPLNPKTQFHSPSFDLGYDFFGGLLPNEWSRIFVPVLRPYFNRLL
ncbi:hypothetical protein [Acidithrix ferrooxidans]|uniref:hypothetical protein n=1 Tax=Acidithrix ferrooxidans TaxID=1280514 RepID=UPI0006985918|nr:hypothetical protein [Acidithrix ferrooxidans]